MHGEADSIQIVWSALTMLLALCKTTRHIIVVRFFVGRRRFIPCLSYDILLMPAGLAESIFWPGIHYILGSWYRRDELGKRASIFYMSGQIAAIVSGYLMAGAFRLNNIGSIWGWQW